MLPVARKLPTHGTSGTGLGDVELGIKYRFVNGKDGTGQVGVFPMIELATGSDRRGLGNGRNWYRLPLWFPKGTGVWTLGGGGGMIINPALDARRRTVSPKRHGRQPAWLHAVERGRLSQLQPELQPAVFHRW